MVAAPPGSPALSSRSTTSGSSTATSASKSPCRSAARNASTTRRWRTGSTCRGGVAPWTRRRARLASWRVATGERSRMGAMSSKGTAKMSCRTKARRSAGARVSSTTISAGPIESASRTAPSGPSVSRSAASGSSSASDSSRRPRRDRSIFRHSRATTVVSHPARFSTSEVSAPLSRSQEFCTASSASACEPSIRKATAPRRPRCSSNRAARHSSLSIRFIAP